MALAKYGGGIIQLSGSIAGNTFARNRFGNYVRARTKPINPKSNLQNAIRASIAYLADRWSNTLDDAKRQAWNTYGDRVNMLNRLGEVIHLSGYNHYIRSNAILRYYVQTLVDDGPALFEIPAQDNTLAVTANTADQKLYISFDNTLDWAKELHRN